MPRRKVAMRQTSLLTIVLFLVSAARPAAAETLRCGSVLIQEGAQASYVLAKCGAPTSKKTITEPVYARALNGNIYETGGVTQTQIWRYYRGPGQFPAILKFADGLVQSIEFEKQRGQPSE